MKVIDILGDNRLEPYMRTRVGCRGVVMADGKLLVSREEISDYWMLPGGGLEEGETLAQCCAREILEETGYVVEPVEQYLTLNEYYEECRYISHFFVCRMIGMGEQSLTETERSRGLVPRWVDVSFFVGVVSEHERYSETNKDKQGSYLREHTAITEYLTYHNE